MNITREEFKLMAAGNFVLGKPSVDIQNLQIYVDAALFAYDFIAKKTIENKKRMSALTSIKSAGTSGYIDLSEMPEMATNNQ